MRYTLIVIIGILIFAVIRLFPNYSKIRELQEENQQYEQRISSMKKEIDTLNHDLEHFQKDSFYVEKIARNELGIARENEVIVHVEQ